MQMENGGVQAVEGKPERTEGGEGGFGIPRGKERRKKKSRLVYWSM